MKYPKEYLDEIKLRLKVSQVVGKTVQLKKRGKEFVGLSPFKNEKSPSFTVNDDKEFYHCFSSGEHGNIFDFVMKTKSVGFGEAVKNLAAEAGMQPYRFSNFDKKKDLRFQNYKSILKDYSTYFHQQLFDSNNKEALEYLTKRGLSKKIIEEFKLGYVPWKNNFYNNLIKKYSEKEIDLSGLFYKNEKTGKYIDRFNSRVIFPVNNLSEDTIAFGGRIIKESKLAKYINSPETEFYKKGSIIFNLDKAKNMRSETDEVLIVEGYMDVVSVYASGIKNVVANSGTAITDRQINLIWKFFSSPTICLDGDESGQKAALRIAERLFSLINEKNKIFFSIMPDGKDPDDFIKENGKDSFLKLINQKEIIQNFLWNYQLSKIDKSNPFEVSKFEKEIKKMCYTIKDETLKKYVLEDFLDKLNHLIPIQTFKQRNRFTKSKYNRNYQLLNETKLLYQKRKNLSKVQVVEFSILYLILNYPNISSNRLEELSEIEFLSEKNESLKKTIISNNSSDKNEKIILEKIEDEYKKVIEEIRENSNIQLIVKDKSEKEILTLLDELINDLKEQYNLRKIESLEKKLLNNLDENSFSELIKLKSQLNRD